MRRLVDQAHALADRLVDLWHESAVVTRCAHGKLLNKACEACDIHVEANPSIPEGWRIVNASSHPTLWEFMGLTEEEYRDFVEQKMIWGRDMFGPARMSDAEVAKLLREIAAGIDAGETDEGFVEFLVPDWSEGGTAKELPEDFDPHALDVRSNYRIGRDMGQGGVRIIGINRGEADDAKNVVGNREPDEGDRGATAPDAGSEASEPEATQ